ncbi:MAG: hypothetical protein P0Y62_17275 [Candidatus Chryseobacterium colombiense]|nr:hypothetical protein [Chryseobacterium sp.]WEK69558.1 MAG: hypothetical protein P0Y62_17275 [Chryseobacterium sp.]
MNKLKKFFLVNSLIIILLSIISCNEKKEISNNIFQYYNNNIPQYIIFQEKKQLYPNIPITILGYNNEKLKVKKQGLVFLCEEIQMNKSNSNFDSLIISYNTKGLEGKGIKQFDAKVFNNILIFTDVESKKSGLISLNNMDEKWMKNILSTISSDNRLIKKNISSSENENSFSIIYYKNKKKYFIVGNQINKDANIKLLLVLINMIINSNQNNYRKKDDIHYESLDSLNNYIKKYKIGVERIPDPVIP